MTDPRLPAVLDHIREGGPMDDDPRDHEPDGLAQWQIDQRGDEAADLDQQRRTV